MFLCAQIKEAEESQTSQRREDLRLEGAVPQVCGETRGGGGGVIYLLVLSRLPPLTQPGVAGPSLWEGACELVMCAAKPITYGIGI